MILQWNRKLLKKPNEFPKLITCGFFFSSVKMSEWVNWSPKKLYRNQKEYCKGMEVVLVVWWGPALLHSPFERRTHTEVKETKKNRENNPIFPQFEIFNTSETKDFSFANQIKFSSKSKFKVKLMKSKAFRIEHFKRNNSWRDYYFKLATERGVMKRIRFDLNYYGMGSSYVEGLLWIQFFSMIFIFALDLTHCISCSQRIHSSNWEQIISMIKSRSLLFRLFD